MLRRLLWLLPVALLFWNLGFSAFWNPDEGRYVAASYEMAHPFDGAAPDWLVPHLDTVPRLNKPPLIYWTMAVSMRAFGAREWSARLVPALASLSVLILIAVWGARVWNARTGWAGAMAWASGVGVVAMGRIANTDMLLCAAIALTMFGTFWATELQGARRWQMGALAGVGMGLALLAKGPVGVALPLLFMLVYLTLAGRWKYAPWGALMLALGVALVIGAPWFGAVEAQRPGFAKSFLGDENLKRFQGDKDFHKATPFWYYLPVVAGGLLPWTGFLAPALGVWRRAFGLVEARQARAQLFLTVWAVLLTAFFSASGTKLMSYVLPAFPALALLIGVAVADWDALKPIWKRLSVGVNVLIYAVLIVALIAVPARDKVSKSWGFKLGVLMDDQIVPRAIGEPWTWGLVALVAIFGAASLWAMRRDGRLLLAIQSAGAVAIVVSLLGLAQMISVYEDVTQIVARAATVMRPDDRIASFRAFVPGIIPYVGRPITMLRFSNNSGLRAADVAASPYYSTQNGDEALKKWLRKPGRAFVVTEGLEDAQLARELYVWGRTNEFFLLCNRPRPANFTVPLDFTAPKKRVKHPLFVLPASK